MADGEAWNRTADWKALFQSGLRNKETHAEEDLKSMDAVYASCLRRGLVKDTSTGLVEALCGSFGQRRGDHPVSFEPAVVYTHHPTAPPLRVCFLCHAGCSVSCFWHWLAALLLLGLV